MNEKLIVQTFSDHFANSYVANSAAQNAQQKTQYEEMRKGYADEYLCDDPVPRTSLTTDQPLIYRAQPCL